MTVSKSVQLGHHRRVDEPARGGEHLASAPRRAGSGPCRSRGSPCRGRSRRSGPRSRAAAGRVAAGDDDLADLADLAGSIARRSAAYDGSNRRLNAIITGTPSRSSSAIAASAAATSLSSGFSHRTALPARAASIRSRRVRVRGRADDDGVDVVAGDDQVGVRRGLAAEAVSQRARRGLDRIGDDHQPCPRVGGDVRGVDRRSARRRGRRRGSRRLPGRRRAGRSRVKAGEFELAHRRVEGGSGHHVQRLRAEDSEMISTPWYGASKPAAWTARRNAGTSKTPSPGSRRRKRVSSKSAPSTSASASSARRP